MSAMLNGFFVHKNPNLLVARFKMRVEGREANFDFKIEQIPGLTYHLSVRKNNKENFDVFVLGSANKDMVLQEAKAKLPVPILYFIAHVIEVIEEIFGTTEIVSPHLLVNRNHPDGIAFTKFIPIENPQYLQWLKEAVY